VTTGEPVADDDAVAVAVLIPIKAFSQAKRRLARVLEPVERATLARSMAETVVAATHGLPVSVVCDDDDVRVWARERGAQVIWSPGRGLNGAVLDGVAHLAALGFRRAIVAHADLPHARDLRPLARSSGITLVPDRHGDGTNVISIPTDSGFRFSYGPASFARHLVEARRLGLPVHVEHDQRLAWDVDRPADLAHPTFTAPG
jgi:2-phospho-L-lactate guanylyltransferase